MLLSWEMGSERGIRLSHRSARWRNNLEAHHSVPAISSGRNEKDMRGLTLKREILVFSSSGNSKGKDYFLSLSGERR